MVPIIYSKVNANTLKIMSKSNFLHYLYSVVDWNKSTWGMSMEVKKWSKLKNVEVWKFSLNQRSLLVLVFYCFALAHCFVVHSGVPRNFQWGGCY